MERYVHEISGKWVVAHYNARAGQWQTSNVDGHGLGVNYRYSYGPSLESLVRLGAKTYSSRAEACGAAEKCYYIA